MRANEFVKEFGWGKAKEVSSFTSNVCEDPTHFDSDLDIYVHFDDFKGVMDESDVCIHDLKRLVESHELVGSCGGLINSRKLMGKKKDEGFVKYMDFLGCSYPRFLQAIEDVESCQ